MYVYICIYVYINHNNNTNDTTYIYIYIYIYIYTHTHTFPRRALLVGESAGGPLAAIKTKQRKHRITLQIISSNSIHVYTIYMMYTCIYIYIYMYGSQ